METTQEATANIEQAQKRMCIDYERRRPMDPKSGIKEGSLVMIKVHHKKNKMDAKVEGPYLLKSYNHSRTMAVVEDSAKRQWTENAEFLSAYQTGEANPNTQEL